MTAFGLGTTWSDAVQPWLLLGVGVLVLTTIALSINTERRWRRVNATYDRLARRLDRLTAVEGAADVSRCVASRRPGGTRRPSH